MNINESFWAIVEPDGTSIVSKNGTLYQGPTEDFTAVWLKTIITYAENHPGRKERDAKWWRACTVKKLRLIEEHEN